MACPEGLLVLLAFLRIRDLLKNFEFRIKRVTVNEGSWPFFMTIRCPEEREKMRKLLFCFPALIVIFFAAPIVPAADEVLTPAAVSGVWQGYYNTVCNNGYKITESCKLLILPGLGGVLSCNSSYRGSYSVDFDQGEIGSNQLILSDRANPNLIKIIARINRKGNLEGECRTLRNKGDLYKFKKTRALKDEETQLPLSELKLLLK
jgi:hypothetical protein